SRQTYHIFSQFPSSSSHDPSTNPNPKPSKPLSFSDHYRLPTRRLLLFSLPLPTPSDSTEILRCEFFCEREASAAIFRGVSEPVELLDRGRELQALGDFNQTLLCFTVHAAMDAALCVDVHAPLLAENQFTITTLLDSHYVNISYEKSHHKYLSELQFQQMEKDAGSDVLSFKQNAIADRPSRKCFQQTEWAINHVPCPCLSKSHVQAVIWHWRLDPHIINGCDSASVTIWPWLQHRRPLNYDVEVARFRAKARCCFLAKHLDL
ncbi:hypothetical protein SDJN02_02081, partial [Cucurbita argyrosperma subsp. argyrosperma]